MIPLDITTTTTTTTSNSGNWFNNLLNQIIEGFKVYATYDLSRRQLENTGYLDWDINWSNPNQNSNNPMIITNNSNNILIILVVVVVALFLFKK